LSHFRSRKWIDILELLYVPLSKLLYKEMISFQCHWCIHLLPRSLIHTIHSLLSQSPFKSSPMKQGTNQTVAVRTALRRRKAYIKCCVTWIGKGPTMVLRFIFKILGLITIFLISNKNLKRQALTHCSTFVTHPHTQTQTHTKHNCRGCLDNPSKKRGQGCHIYNSDWYRLIPVSNPTD
jgi:hypothetical protein